MSLLLDTHTHSLMHPRKVEHADTMAPYLPRSISIRVHSFKTIKSKFVVFFVDQFKRKRLVLVHSGYLFLQPEKITTTNKLVVAHFRSVMRAFLFIFEISCIENFNGLKMHLFPHSGWLIHGFKKKITYSLNCAYCLCYAMCDHILYQIMVTIIFGVFLYFEVAISKAVVIEDLKMC